MVTRFFLFLIPLLIIGCKDEILSTPDRTGEISGLVFEWTTRSPIAGAVVSIEKTGSRAVTDVDGAFSIAGLNPGEYHAVVRKRGFTQSSFTAVVKSQLITPPHVPLVLLKRK